MLSDWRALGLAEAGHALPMWRLLLGLALMLFGHCIAEAVLTSMFSKRVPPEQSGVMMGYLQFGPQVACITGRAPPLLQYSDRLPIAHPTLLSCNVEIGFQSRIPPSSPAL